MTSRFMRSFLLLTSVIVSQERRTVQRDSYVLLFETVAENNPDKEFSLYKNGTETPNLIATFKVENDAITTIWNLKNYTKISIDAKTNIRIANMDEMYEGKYCIQYFPSLQQREVELIITGNSTDELKAEITERLNYHNFGCESPSGYMIAILVIVIAILVTVIAFLALFLMVHGSEVCKLLINAWSWCRKCTSKKRQEPKQRAGTDPMLPREEDTDTTPMNITESEADFQPTAQGRKKIHIREREL